MRWTRGPPTLWSRRSGCGWSREYWLRVGQRPRALGIGQEPLGQLSKTSAIRRRDMPKEAPSGFVDHRLETMCFDRLQSTGELIYRIVGSGSCAGSSWVRGEEFEVSVGLLGQLDPIAIGATIGKD